MGRSFDLPASVDTIDRGTIQNGQPMVNLSETLVRIPGITALNRQNYAQDLQISSRGFGARSTFGVRGIRLYQDDIPATMPDGQGQTGSFSLLSAQRVEVLRGPFSTLYGNASGGVISVYTEDGTDRPELTTTVGAGSDRAHTLGFKLTGSTEPTNPGADRIARYVAAVSRFDTEGYRDHSAARRDLVNSKVGLALAPGTKLTLIGSTQYQPETQDPLGLTRAQWQANPRSVDASALQYDTRKTIRQEQGGATLDQRVSPTTDLKLTGYYGQRRVRQYLALRGDGATSSGGVPDLDRSFDGASARFTWRAGTALPLSIAAGIDFDRQDEHRRGYVNDNGNLGDLRRDEDNRVQSTAVYGQIEWSPWSSASLTGGVRSANVSFRSADHYVTALNPDDSGSTSFSNVAPVFGAVYHVSDNVNVYASYGTGFETPTGVGARIPPQRNGPQLRSRRSHESCDGDRGENAHRGPASPQCGPLHHDDEQGDRGRHRDGWPDHLQERRPHRACGRRGRLGWAAHEGADGARGAHLAARDVRRRVHHRDAADDGAGGSQAARRAAAFSVCGARVDRRQVWQDSTLRSKSSTPGRST